eukprot:CAMPEP_0115366050 /NCGR_PEP_ID=MMETSP0270-20121206/104602_1 /TAXON_ID=71861 /ORGANISM="Scrippsiella trochoidea, Strain CCMP3099" /LENGTH=293 /DNA_ID=CAMNT_0002788803 /DNA_START=1 /DNA_END=879 /DNA_ORIENTATION=-
MSMLQSVASWGEFLVGGNCLSSAGRRRGDGGSICSKVKELCAPPYESSEIDVLEYQRDKLGLALVGQLVVVICRVLTGHLTTGCIGFCVFALGNNVRCELRPVSIISFVAVSLTVGSLDFADFMHELLKLGSGFVVLPVHANLAKDLAALALAWAPASEVGGAKLAWDLYTVLGGRGCHRPPTVEEPMMVMPARPCPIGNSFVQPCVLVPYWKGQQQMLRPQPCLSALPPSTSWVAPPVAREEPLLRLAVPLGGLGSLTLLGDQTLPSMTPMQQATRVLSRGHRACHGLLWRG